MDWKAIDRLKIGIVFTAVGILCALAAVWLVREGIYRWMAIWNLHNAIAYDFAGKRIEARRNAEIASSWYPDHPTIVLANLNPEKASAGTLQGLLRDAKPDQRRIIQTSSDFCRLLGGEAPQIASEGSDAELLQFMAALRRPQGGPLPGFPNCADARRAPQIALLTRASEDQLMASWQNGDGKAFREAAGRLITLVPRHTAARQLELALGLLGPQWDQQQLNRFLDRCRSPEKQAEILRPLAMLLEKDPGLLALPPGTASAVAEERRRAIQALVPAHLRSEGERLAGLVADGQPLAKAAEELAKHPDAATGNLIAAKAVMLRDWKALDFLIKHGLVAKGRLDEFRLHLAVGTGDVPALEALEPIFPGARAQIPRIVGLRRSLQEVSFHCITALGLPVGGDIAVFVNQRPIIAENLKRAGSLVTVIIPPTTSVEVAVQLNGATIFQQKIAPPSTIVP